jgi:hypothetical protein
MRTFVASLGWQPGRPVRSSETGARYCYLRGEEGGVIVVIYREIQSLSSLSRFLACYKIRTDEGKLFSTDPATVSSGAIQRDTAFCVTCFPVSHRTAGEWQRVRSPARRRLNSCPYTRAFPRGLGSSETAGRHGLAASPPLTSCQFKSVVGEAAPAANRPLGRA